MAQEFDVLLSDIAMPGLDGSALILQVRAAGARTDRPLRAVAVTAHTGAEVWRRTLAAGFDACATKPVDADELLELLERLL
jgi:two-component system CheB/CheR fusion protein